MNKKSWMSIIFWMSLSSITFASNEDSSPILKKIAQSALKAFTWGALAFSLGILIWIGVKYVMSGANERANLKGKMPKYLLGVALIALCSFIALGVARLAGNEDEKTIVDTGVELSGLTIGVKKQDDVAAAGKRRGQIDLPSTMVGALYEWDSSKGDWVLVDTVDPAEGGKASVAQWVGQLEVGKRYKLEYMKNVNGEEDDIYYLNGQRFKGWDIYNGEILDQGDGTVIFTANNNMLLNPIYGNDTVVGAGTQITTGQVEGYAEAHYTLPENTKFAVTNTKAQGDPDTTSLGVTIRGYDGTTIEHTDYNSITQKKMQTDVSELNPESNGTRTEAQYLTGDKAGNLASGTYYMSLYSNGSSTNSIREDNLTLIQFDEKGNATNIDMEFYYADGNKVYAKGSDGEKIYVDPGELPYPYVVINNDGSADFYGNLDFDNNAYVFNLDNASGMDFPVPETQVVDTSSGPVTYTGENVVPSGFNPSTADGSDSYGNYVYVDESGQTYFIQSDENGNYQTYTATESSGGYVVTDADGNEQFITYDDDDGYVMHNIESENP